MRHIRIYRAGTFFLSAVLYVTAAMTPITALAAPADLNEAAAQQEEACKHQVAELTTALENTKMLFQHSTSTTYLETLTAQQSLIQAQLTLISDKFDKVQAAINLYQALGGGRETENN